MNQESHPAQPPKTSPEPRPLAELREQLDAWMDEVTRPCGALIIDAPLGLDLEPQLRPWLQELAEDGEIIVEVAARSPQPTAPGSECEDRPEALREQLARAIEARFPDFVDHHAPFHTRLSDLLTRLSKRHLAPPSRTLLLVVHDLERLRMQSPDDNPLPRLLPHIHPRGVFLIVTARPPMSASPWLAALADRETISVAAPVNAETSAPAAGPAPSEPFAIDPDGVSAHLLRDALTDANWQNALELATDAVALTAIAAEGRLGALVADLGEAALRDPDPERSALFSLLRASLVAAAPTIAADPLALPAILWGELIDRGLTTDALEELFGEQRPALRRRLPRHHREGAETLFEGHAGAILDLALSPDGRLLASASADRTIKLWALPSGREHLSLCGHRGAVNACTFTPEGHLLTASDDGLILLWSVDSAAQLGRYQGHGGGIEGLALSSDGRTLLSLGADGLLIHWEREGLNARERARVEAHELGGTALALSPDEGCVATGSHDKSVKLWQLPDLSLAQTLRGPEYAISGLSFAPDGRSLAASAYDNLLWVWSLPGGELEHELQGHGSWVTSCAFIDGQRLLSSSRDRSVRLWDLSDRGEHLELRGHTAMVNAALAHPDRSSLYSAGKDQAIRRWRVPHSELGGPAERDRYPGPAAVDGHEGAIRACLIDHDVLYSASADGTLRRWDRLSGAPLGIYSGHEHAVLGATLRAASGTLISTGSDRTIKIWDTANQACVRELVGHQKWISACALSPDGAHLATASYDTTLKVWDFATGEEIRTLKGHQDAVRTCLYGPAGSILSAGDDGMIRLWDPSNESELMTLAGHEGPVLALALSPDGKRLLSAGDDGTLRLWSLRRGRERATLRGHRGAVVGVGFIDDAHVVSVGVDRSLRLWSLNDGRSLATLRGHHPFAALTVAPSEEEKSDAVADILAGDEAGDLWFIAIDLASLAKA